MVSVNSISAAHTLATAADCVARPGKRASFTIVAHDSTGARHKVGGDTFVVQLQTQQQDEKEEEKKKEAVLIHSQQTHPQASRDHLLREVQVADQGDGTYEVSFVLPLGAVGDQKLCVFARFPYSRQPISAEICRSLIFVVGLLLFFLLQSLFCCFLSK